MLGPALPENVRLICEPIAEEIAYRWNLKLGYRLPGASASYVVEATTSDGLDAVLKVPIPGDDEAVGWRGVEAFSEYGGVKMLRLDEESGSILMPRLRPGSMLAHDSMTDLDAVDVCADLILRLRESKPSSPSPLRERFKPISNIPSALQGLAGQAWRIANELFETTDRQVNLHGDLHQFNIIRGAHGWTAIDPKFLLGDPCHEVTGFMRNTPKPTTEQMDARLFRFAEKLGDPIERLWGWSFAQTVLCCAWCSGPIDESVWVRAAECIWEARPKGAL
jgi:streptomycin 6-kinase